MKENRGRKLAGIRWTLPQAKSEFQIHQETLAKRIKATGVLPGEDGCYSTFDIHRAIAGDLYGAKTRKETAAADREEVKAAKDSKTVVEYAFVERAWEAVVGLVKKRLLLIPTKFESQWRPEMTQQQAKKIIETEVDESLSELAKEIEYFRLEETPEDAGETVGAPAEAED